MKEKLISHILKSSFPCVMAKAVAKTGLLKVHTQQTLDPKNFLKNIYEFIDEFRGKTSRLSSFVLVLENNLSFERFEEMFWEFLQDVNHEDKKYYPHDPRVKPKPEDDEFSYSIKSEAFFILALHPDSPRKSRQFTYPAIVFNPHQQFENMRKNGIFNKVRTMIRTTDKILQGTVNPMLQDFGERSEVFQYLGRVYSPNEPIPLHI